MDAAKGAALVAAYDRAVEAYNEVRLQEAYDDAYAAAFNAAWDDLVREDLLAPRKEPRDA